MSYVTHSHKTFCDFQSQIFSVLCILFHFVVTAMNLSKCTSAMHVLFLCYQHVYQYMYYSYVSSKCTSTCIILMLSACVPVHVLFLCYQQVYQYMHYSYVISISDTDTLKTKCRHILQCTQKLFHF